MTAMMTSIPWIWAPLVREYDVMVDGVHVEVFRPDPLTYEGWVLILNGGDPIPIDDVKRFRDGGTTVMRSRAGRLIIYSPFKDRSPEWEPAALDLA